MLNLKKKRNSEIEESHKYAANTLSHIAAQKNKKIFAVTSSCFRLPYRSIAKNIFEKVSGKSLLLDVYIDGGEKETVDQVTKFGDRHKIKLVNVSQKTFKRIICENESSYDIILCIIPPVDLKADALEYAKICKNAVLIEKYTWSRYEDYENSLLRLKNANINIDGVIACK